MPSKVSPLTVMLPRLVTVLWSYTRMALLPLMTSSVPSSTFTEMLVLPNVAATEVLEGLGGIVLLHVTVCPLAGVALSQPASAGDTRNRIRRPSAEEVDSNRRLGTKGEHARRIRSSVEGRRHHCPWGSLTCRVASWGVGSSGYRAW